MSLFRYMYITVSNNTNCYADGRSMYFLPFAIMESYIPTDFVFSMWIPSVLGLSFGDDMESFSISTSSQPSNFM